MDGAASAEGFGASLKRKAVEIEASVPTHIHAPRPEAPLRSAMSALEAAVAVVAEAGDSTVFLPGSIRSLSSNPPSLFPAPPSRPCTAEAETGTEGAAAKAAAAANAAAAVAATGSGALAGARVAVGAEAPTQQAKKPKPLAKMPERKTMVDFKGSNYCTNPECKLQFAENKMFRPHGHNMYKTDCRCGKTNYKKRDELIDG